MHVWNIPAFEHCNGVFRKQKLFELAVLLEVLVSSPFRSPIVLICLNKFWLHVRSRQLFPSECKNEDSHCRSEAGGILMSMRKRDGAARSSSAVVDGISLEVFINFCYGRSMCLSGVRNYGTPLPAITRFEA